MLTALEKRLVEISYKLHLSHLSAYFTSIDLIDKIYSVKKKDEPFIFSQEHAFAALFADSRVFYQMVDQLGN